MQEPLTNLLDFVGLAWWVEITTDSPRCIYYFGPFPTQQKAETAKPGYVEDLQQEGAQGITFAIKRCKPAKLTIYDERGESWSKKVSPSFSSQLP